MKCGFWLFFAKIDKHPAFENSELYSYLFKISDQGLFN